MKDVFVTVPQAVNVGDTVTLQCRYDLEGEALYMVKWYRHGREFFRYIPKEMPSTQVFPYPGIDVDVSVCYKTKQPKNLYLILLEKPMSTKSRLFTCNSACYS